MQKLILMLSGLAAIAAAGEVAALTPTAIDNRQSAVADGPDAVTIPRMLSYQGKLTDAGGNAVPDTTYSVAFRLYTLPSGGTQFWTETQTVRTKNGLFSVLLGSVTPIGTMPDAGAVYLGMAVGGGAELTPRLRIASAAYAYLTERAANSDLLQGKDTTALDGRYVNEAQVNSVTSAMITNGTIAAADLGQMGAATGQVMKWTGSVWAPRNDSVGGGGTGDNAWVRGTPDSVLYTTHRLGIARGGSDNMLHGGFRQSHINLGVSCTTGTSGLNNANIVVAGGFGNRARAALSSVGGGTLNVAAGLGATVAGGAYNVAGDSVIDTCAVVAGGYGNAAARMFSMVGGGYQNRSSGWFSTVGGGASNRASGDYATVPGGSNCHAGGDYSFVAGRNASATARGCFVWADATTPLISTFADNRWLVRSSGGATFYTDSLMASGARLPAGASSWSPVLDSLNMTDFRPVDRRALFDALVQMRVREYSLTTQDPSIRHIGPVAQDFHKLLGYGESNTAINSGDIDGVLLAAVQALYEQNRLQQAEIEALKAALAEGK